MGMKVGVGIENQWAKAKVDADVVRRGGVSPRGWLWTNRVSKLRLDGLRMLQVMRR
jgi:hypothetical protein